MSPSDTLSTGRGALVLYLLQAKERTGEALLGAEPAGLGLGVSLLWRNLQHLGCLYKAKGMPFHWVSIPRKKASPVPGNTHHPPPWRLTWAVCRLLSCHLHEKSHLLALGEGVAGSDPRQPHAKQQPGLPGDRLLLNPLPLRTLLLCEAMEERGEISCHGVLRI